MQVMRHVLEAMFGTGQRPTDMCCISAVRPANICSKD
jgi:hypothetical protein